MEFRETELDPEKMKRIEQSLYAAADFAPEREMPADLIARALGQRRSCRSVLPRRAALAAGLGLLALMLAAAFRWRAPESVQMAGHHSPPPVILERKTPEYLLPEPNPSHPKSLVPVKGGVSTASPQPTRENALRKRSSAKPSPRREIRRRVRPAEPYRPPRIYASHPERTVQAVRWQEEVVKAPPTRVLAPGWILQPDPQQQAVYITPAVAEFPLSNE